MSFTTLEIARSALATSRAALEIAGHNVANANTPGYVRQRLRLAPLSSAYTFNAAGGGVTVAGIDRLRDQCLETQINHQEGRLGRESSLTASLQRIQNIFPDLQEQGISHALSDLFSAAERLQVNPGSPASREELLFHAGSLCYELNEAVRKLGEEERNVNAELENQVARFNQLLHQVAELNGKIMLLGENTGDLKVLREEAIRELARLGGAMGLDQPSGSQDVLLGGVRLVQDTTVTELRLYPDPLNPSRQLVAAGDIEQPDNLNGIIAGLLEVRDQHITRWNDHLNTLARTIADAFNAQHATGYDLDGRPGGDFFVYDPGAPASTLAVSEAIRTDNRLLAAASTSWGPPGDGTNAGLLAGLRNQPLFSGGTITVGEYHAELIHAIGFETSRNISALEARRSLVQSLDNHYINQAGVSLDEEAVDVMRYQQMYNAAARLISAAMAMMDSLMELT